jgi:hypothetical protein
MGDGNNEHSMFNIQHSTLNAQAAAVTDAPLQAGCLQDAGAPGWENI